MTPEQMIYITIGGVYLVRSSAVFPSNHQVRKFCAGCARATSAFVRRVWVRLDWGDLVIAMLYVGGGLASFAHGAGIV